MAHCFKGVAYRYHRPLEPLFRALIPQDALVVDAGAHSGQFAKIFAECAPDGLVLAVEPAAYPLSILRIVARAHRWRSVEIVAMGLGERDGELVLRTPVKANGVPRFGLASVVADRATDACLEQTIAVTTIDALVEKYGGGRRCAFVKADIEGNEHAMLLGTLRTMEKHAPAFLLEVSRDAGAIGALLRERGYAMFETENYEAQPGAPVKIRECLDGTTAGGNILAVHRARTADLERVRAQFC